MSVIQGVNVGKSFGAYDVFADFSFSLARGDKIALVGPNGCGKTTLLRVVAGLDESTAGNVTFARGTSVGYLAQTAEESADVTVWQEMTSAFAEINALAARLREIEHALAEPDTGDRLLERYGELQHEFERMGGYEVDSRIRRVLGGLGFKPGEENQPLSHLSGGQRVRAALARLLLLAPDVLLLDEPTNHLDTRGIEWLESYLQDWDGTLIVVSHDRYFLDEVCDDVWEMTIQRAPTGELRLSRLDTYRGGYTDYIAQRTERRARQIKAYEAQQEVIARQSDYIRRNSAGQNALQAKGRLKRLNRMERLEKPIEARALSIRLDAGARSGNIVIETKGVVVGYADGGPAPEDEASPALDPVPPSSAARRPLFRAPDLQLLRRERAALVGPNGTGKTTFLKTICGDLAPLDGTVRIGANVKIGYFAQAHEGLDLERTVLEELMSARGDLTVPQARAFLGRFLFSGDDAFKTIDVLSGGERGRVALAKLTLQGANFLLLDEPTNHLDIPAQEILTEALDQFDGTLLLVSHDRYLVAALATQIWSLERDDAGETRLTVFRSTYDAWMEARERAAEEGRAQSTEHRAQNTEHRTQSTEHRTQKSEDRTQKSEDRTQKSEDRSQNAEDRAPKVGERRSKNAERARQAQIEQVERHIETLDTRLAELAQNIQASGHDYARIQALGVEYEQTQAALAAAWDELTVLSE